MSEQGVEQWTEDAALGEPVLRMMVEDMVLLIRTDWGLFVRKSRNQLKSDGLVRELTVYSLVSAV